MPAVKKTEPLPRRKSDSETAQFVLAEPDPDDDPAFDPPTAPVSTATVPPSQPGPSSQSKDKDSTNGKDKDTLAIEDLTLPKSIITRLAKGVLQPNTQIQANAILALSKSATVFINYLAHHANENTLSAGKKTIMPADVFKAIEETEMGFMRAKLEAEFSKFHETNSAKRSSYRKKVAMTKKPSGSADVSMTAGDDSIMSSTSMPPRGGGGGRGHDSDDDVGDDDDDDDVGRSSTVAPKSKKPKLVASRGGKAGTTTTTNINNNNNNNATAGKMDIDGELSDAETVPDDLQDEDGEDDDDDVEEEDDDDDDDDDEEEEEEQEDGENMDEDQRERRDDRRNYDEALDDSSDGD